MQIVILDWDKDNFDQIADNRIYIWTLDGDPEEIMVHGWLYPGAPYLEQTKAKRIDFCLYELELDND